MTYELRQLSRQRLEARELPEDSDGWIVGGPSAGTICGLCGQPIVRGSPEIELQWSPSTALHKLAIHAECHSVWSIVLRERQRRAKESD